MPLAHTRGMPKNVAARLQVLSTKPTSGQVRFGTSQRTDKLAEEPFEFKLLGGVGGGGGGGGVAGGDAWDRAPGRHAPRRRAWCCRLLPAKSPCSLAILTLEAQPSH